jgi:putative nucleotidyltransferase with HDIG domain
MGDNAIGLPSASRETGIPPASAETIEEIAVPPKFCNLPPFHTIANQVLSLSADQDVDLPKLASVIERDPAFAAEVLFLANSPLFGFPSKMHAVRHAVTILGLDRIKALTVTVAMKAYLGTASPLVRQCWRHSAACAVIAEEISAPFGLPGDQAYTAALLHDIGRLGLLKSYAREVAPVLTAKYRDPADALLAERAAINVDHGLAGAWLVKTWAFPLAFAEVCEHHHGAFRPSDSPLLKAVKAACRIADAFGYAATRCSEIPGYPEVLSTLCGPAPREKFPGEEALRKNVEARLAAFEQ